MSGVIYDGHAFSELFDDQMTRSELVTMFLAVLELVKLNRISAEQEDPYGEITLRSRGARRNREGHAAV